MIRLPLGMPHLSECHSNPTPIFHRWLTSTPFHQNKSKQIQLRRPGQRIAVRINLVGLGFLRDFVLVMPI